MSKLWEHDKEDSKVMTMNFDVVFLDVTSPRYYDRVTLEKSPMGGTEASVVRVAEALAQLGLKVAVMQSRCKYFEPVMGQYCFFLHADDSEKVTTKHYIQIRANDNPGVFKGAKKYIWLHDVAGGREKAWAPSLEANNVTLIGVSQWHRKNIISESGYDKNKVKYIYNPVPDELYVPSGEAQGYDSNIMAWMSSPHKGLGKALEMLSKIREKLPKMQLIVFNPGYMNLDLEKLSVMPGVSVYGALSCKQMWNVLRKCMCVFYPTDWNETFGCIAAEANALGVPLITYRKAGLKESVSSDIQMLEEGDESGVVQRVADWSTNGRPRVAGQDRFRTSEVVVDWVKLLAR